MAKEGNNYVPNPIDTSGIELTETLRELISMMAQRAHEDWFRLRTEEAQREGLSPEQMRQKYPNYMPWNELSDSMKQSAIDSASEAAKVIEQRFGVDNLLSTKAYDREQIVDAVAENAHEVWARQRMEAGWTYGEKRDNEAKKHPMLIPYDELPESEKEYDKAYGRILCDCMEEKSPHLKEDRKWKEALKDAFERDWHIDPFGTRATHIGSFARVWEKMTNKEQLELVTKCINQQGFSHDLGVLEGRLSARVDRASDAVVRGVAEAVNEQGEVQRISKGDHAEYDRLSRIAAREGGKFPGMGLNELKKLSPDSVLQLREAALTMKRAREESRKKGQGQEHEQKPQKTLTRRERQQMALKRFEDASKGRQLSTGMKR